MKKQIKEMADDAEEFALSVKEKVTGYILAGFGLVTALAWNDAVKAVIENFYPLEQDSLMAKMYYAFAMTVLVVIVTAVLMRFTKKSTESKSKK